MIHRDTVEIRCNVSKTCQQIGVLLRYLKGFAGRVPQRTANRSPYAIELYALAKVLDRIPYHWLEMPIAGKQYKDLG